MQQVPATICAISRCEITRAGLCGQSKNPEILGKQSFALGKKTEAREGKEILQVQIFQWEFLRRNPDYKQDYDRLIRRFGAWFRENGYWYERHQSYTRQASVFFINEICPVLNEICRKWQISDPFSPEWKFDLHGLHEYAPHCCVYVPTGYTAGQAAQYWAHVPVQLIQNAGELEPFSSPFRSLSPLPIRQKRRPQPDDVRHLNLRLDATLPLRELLDQTARAVRFHRRKYSQQLRMFKDEPKTRRRLLEYRVYLKIWDLRLQRKTFPEIANIVFPREYASHPRRRNPLVQRVTDEYARAKELIMGGYKELR